MGLIKIFGKVISIGARDKFSDEDFALENEHFEKEIEKFRKNNVDEELINQQVARQIVAAFEHQSAKSAFWWFEHDSVNSTNVQFLHIKFKRSLESDASHDKVVTREQQEQFVTLTLPNLDYSVFGCADKSEYAKKIMVSYDAQFKSDDKNIKRNISPFLTFEFWLCCSYKGLVAEGKTIDSEIVAQSYSSWLNTLINKMNSKYGGYYGGIIWYKDIK